MPAAPACCVSTNCKSPAESACRRANFSRHSLSKASVSPERGMFAPLSMRCINANIHRVNIGYDQKKVAIYLRKIYSSPVSSMSSKRYGLKPAARSGLFLWPPCKSTARLNLESVNAGSVCLQADTATQADDSVVRNPCYAVLQYGCASRLDLEPGRARPLATIFRAAIGLQEGHCHPSYPLLYVKP